MGIRGAALGALIGVAVVALSGCAAGPNRDEVAERFAIEMAAGPGEQEDWAEFAEGLADDALAGNCAKDGYRAGLGDDPTLIYAWSAGCLMYFEDQMTNAQQERARQDVIDFTIASLDE